MSMVVFLRSTMTANLAAFWRGTAVDYASVPNMNPDRTFFIPLLCIAEAADCSLVEVAEGSREREKPPFAYKIQTISD